MDPNEFNEELSFDDIPEEVFSDPQPQEPVFPDEPEDFWDDDEIPVPEPEPESTYHGAGTGRKESTFTGSSCYTPPESEPRREQRKSTYQPPWQTDPGSYEYEAPAKRKAKKKRSLGRTGRRILAAVAAFAVLAGSCGITASVVNNRWEREMNQLETEMEQRIEALENQVNTLPDQVVVPGDAVSYTAMSPSQVYAMNVNSVVSISNYATMAGNFWGGISGEQLISSGSGFIITEDGYVVTNYHVVEGAERITVTTGLGDEYDAKLMGQDKLNDVALLKVEATGLDAVAIGSSADLQVGDQVVAIGNPLGELTSTQTVGYISGKDRSVTTDGSIINMLQTDAAINSGNSGGPLFNMEGQVIGITTAKYSGSSGSGASIEGIGFAIPIDDVMSMIDDLKDYGYVKNQAYLGVEIMDMDASTASMYSLPQGSYVAKVVEGGSAQRAGVREKDIIIALGEYTVTGNSELTATLRKFSAGDTTTITVFRAGQELVLDITFDEKPQNLDTQPTEETLPGEMPRSGSFDEWYDYFAPYFGEGNG